MTGRRSLDLSGGGAPGKYDPLGEYLKAHQGSQVQITFAHVEQIISDRLPPSARTYREWWANHRSHIQAVSWMEAGWRCGPVDMKGEVATFTRDG